MLGPPTISRAPAFQSAGGRLPDILVGILGRLTQGGGGPPGIRSDVFEALRRVVTGPWVGILQGVDQARDRSLAVFPLEFEFGESLGGVVTGSGVAVLQGVDQGPGGRPGVRSDL